uniref:ER membrane protein complex subunit 2 n=1 Tax=Nicotiana sylvestris TaxID=4096 RepID=A0A1U7VTA3_NICSY|nr:PREDICTED: ER membrane protein complex subunit 2-like [Nicotiana sylvestris]
MERILISASLPEIITRHRSFWVEQVLYTLGGLENLQMAKKYYASTIDLTGGKSTRALFGICLCTSAIAQLSKGRSKEDKESSELQSLSAMALEKDYKQRAPSNLSVLSSTLRSLKI